MQIRPLTQDDLTQVDEIDATIESTQYLHVNVSGEGLARAWSLEVRPLREKLIDANRIGDEVRFALKQVTNGIEEGLVLAAEHRGEVLGTLLAQLDERGEVLRIRDLRGDYDQRRQGLGMGLVYQAISFANERKLRAVQAECRTNNEPANRMLAKCGFELSGLDTLRHSNHDLVKEAVTLVWYVPLG
jgi:RimJ/RimL family protein N-acetyltransferase